VSTTAIRGADDHRCPVGDCKRRVPAHQLMCARHWRLVPRDIQRVVYRAWRRGRGAGTAAHQEAMAAAITAVEEGERA
jgi:hypothetical protein